jgi:hypothetical protein
MVGRHEDGDLWDPGFCDHETAEERPAVKRARAVVSVAFPRQDYDLVAEAARRADVRISEFIRRAAMTAAAPRTTRLSLITPGFPSWPRNTTGDPTDASLTAIRTAAGSGATGQSR